MDAMKKAIFLDRDGVINSNRDRYYTWKPEDLENQSRRDRNTQDP